MIDFPITENQIRVLSDEKLREVLELCHVEHTRRQKEYFEIVETLAILCKNTILTNATTTK